MAAIGIDTGKAIRSRRAASEISFEVLAYSAVTLLAMGLRLYALGEKPLAPSEAAPALAAWQFATGRPYDLEGLSPLLFDLQALVFMVFGATDTLARFAPGALNGLAVLLFPRLRGRLGFSGALAAALLWAISPLATCLSRTAVSYSLVPPLVLLLVIALDAWIGRPARSAATAAVESRAGTAGWQAAAPSPQGGAIACGITLGLMVSSSPSWLSAAMAMLGGLAVIGMNREFDSRSRDELRSQVASSVRPFAAAFAASLALVATACWMVPSGLSVATGMIGAWFRATGSGDDAYTVGHLVRILLVNEPLLIGCALGGLWLAVRRHYTFRLAVAAGTLVALVLALALPARSPHGLQIVLLGLAVVGGPALANIAECAWRQRRSVDAGLLLVISLVLVGTCAISLAGIAGTTSDAYRRMVSGIGIGTFVLGAGIWLVTGFWGERVHTGRTLAVLGVLVGLGWGAAQLSASSYAWDWARRSAVFSEEPGLDIIYFRQQVRSLIALHGPAAGAAGLDLVTGSPQPNPVVGMLMWELRNYPELRVVAGLSQTTAPIVITISDGVASGDVAAGLEGPGKDYRGSSYTLLERWSPEGLDGRAWTRWLLYREARSPGTGSSIILWRQPKKEQPGF